MEEKVWVFADFTEGQKIGSVDVDLDDRKLALWHSIYPTESQVSRIPQGLLIAAMMEAYLKVIPERPPGNVHAGQKLTFTGEPVMPGDRLRLDFSCFARTIRKERRWVTLGVSGFLGGRSVFEGEIVTVWAK